MAQEKFDLKFQELMLQAEIGALVHDIGKFTSGFVEDMVKAESGGAKERFDHSLNFLKNAPDEISACRAKLKEILNSELPESWFNVPENHIKLRKLGDLLRFHHGKGLRKYLKLKAGQPVPLLLSLIMIADSIDSSSSKGGARFNPKDVDRESRLSGIPFSQTASSLYIATPFGEQETAIFLETINDGAVGFQDELAKILKNCGNWDLAQLKDRRKDMLMLMEKRLSDVLAETRLPTNDVSLWQHSYSTACIFKAMLSRHLLLEDYRADEAGDLVYYRERLAFLGVRWREDALLSRAVRPKDILGRRARLLKIKSAIKDKVESDYCLGNEVYEDKDGICFLIPAPEEDNRIRSAIEPLLDDLEEILNADSLFPGDLEYQILCKDVGIRILGLSDLLEGNAEVLRAGPRRPKWIGLWEQGTSKEICSRCGLRPAELVEVTSGSEGDEEKTCSFCRCLANEGGEVRTFSDQKTRQRLFGTKGAHQMLTFETDQLVNAEKENSRVALVQGIFDLRPFLSGEAFSSILGRMPTDYSKKPGSGDKSREMNSWDLLHKGIRESWEEAREGNASQESIHTFQQLFQDTFLATAGDGRVEGRTKEDKLKTYMEEIVLKSPFPPALEDYQKIALHALRQHPAPSRIARIWETTGKLCREAVTWCETNHVRHFPVSIDPGSFQILLPAASAWDFLHGMNSAYQLAAGRIRHLLPFHLSACVFYYKAPLYVAIDAARRFAGLHARGKRPELWQLTGKENHDGFWKLNWLDHLGREVIWNIPDALPNGDSERFFTWFSVEGVEHPVSCKDILKGQKALVWPSTFDYEVLDATTRRYDIRMDKQGKGRPHMFFKKGGPRPYPLSDLERWVEVLPFLEACEPSRQNRLISMVGRLHAEWAGCDPDLFAAQTADCLKLCLGSDGGKLQDAAVSGSLFDMYEWKHFIGK
jgi:hypothetical protein